MTQQVPELLTWGGTEFPTWATPLDPYLWMAPHAESDELGFNTACWRGYMARWEVTHGRLYLIAIRSASEANPLSLRDMFPGFGQRVFAHWFTGKITFPVVPQSYWANQADPLTISLWVQDGKLSEAKKGAHGGYIRNLVSSYDDYLPAMSDLSESISVSEIEANSMVSDPSGAVPNRPFGHLNWKWEAFKAQLAADVVLRRFSYQFGYSHLHGGYASVLNNRIDQFVITSIAEAT